MDLESFYREQRVVGEVRTWLDMFLGRIFAPKPSPKRQNSCTDEMQLVVSGPGSQIFYSIIEQMAKTLQRKIFVPKHERDFGWNFIADLYVVREPQIIDVGMWSSMICGEAICFQTRDQEAVIIEFNMMGLMILDTVDKFGKSSFRDRPYALTRMFHVFLPVCPKYSSVIVPGSYIDICRQEYYSSMNLVWPLFLSFDNWHNFDKRIEFDKRTSADKLAKYIPFYVPLYGEKRDSVAQHVEPCLKGSRPLSNLALSFL